MPGNVQNAVSSGVLPWSLFTAFSESRERPVLISEYRDGSSQRTSLTSTSRLRYSISKRLIAAQMTTLRNFYLANVGKAFKVYRKKANQDAGNTAYKLMRFEGAWNEEITMGRSNITIQLVEVA
jgi:hypothetical protein